MSCSDTVCGTGGWSGPLPGDPDNNGVLSAAPAYGGIDVFWTYPLTNAHAVAHTLLFRGFTNNFDLSTQIAIVAGNTYYDRIPKTEIREYFYWIVFVSINGTYGVPIGPTSSVPKLNIDETIADLTGQIDSGYLAESLRARIDLIEALQRDLSQEVLDRIYDNGTLASALNAVQVETDKALTFILDEIAQRRDADEALITSVNALAVGMDQNSSAIINEQLTRVTADAALSNEVAILYSKASDNEAAIETVKQTLVTADGALSSQISSLTAQQAETAAGIQNEAEVRANGDITLATQIQTSQTVLGDNIASVQTSMESKINTVDGKVADIGALYTAKVDVNGLVGGFGVYNDGQTVEAGFDVDRFWIGRTTNKRKPFIVENDTVYIDEAAINKLTFSKLRDEAGAFVVENGKVKADYINAQGMTLKSLDGTTILDGGTGTFSGQLNIQSSPTGARLEMTNNVIKVYDAAGVLRVKIGNLAA